MQLTRFNLPANQSGLSFWGACFFLFLQFSLINPAIAQPPVAAEQIWYSLPETGAVGVTPQSVCPDGFDAINRWGMGNSWGYCHNGYNSSNKTIKWSQCSSGSVAYNDSSGGVSCMPTSACPEPSVPDQNGNCFQNCPSGEHWNNVEGVCSPNTCYFDNQEWNDITQSCIDACPAGQEQLIEGGNAFCISSNERDWDDTQLPHDPRSCLNVGGYYLESNPVCYDKFTSCVSGGGAVGLVNGETVCIKQSNSSNNDAPPPPNCTSGTVAIPDGSGGFNCQPITDNPDGTNNTPAGGRCNPLTDPSCPNQHGQSGTPTGGQGSGSGRPSSCDGSYAPECSYQPCSVNPSSPECSACVANPLGAACHEPCYGSLVSDGGQCIDCASPSSASNPACHASGSSDHGNNRTYEGGVGCSVTPKCLGDAIDCAVAYQVWRMRCEGDQQTEEIQIMPDKQMLTDMAKELTEFTDMATDTILDGSASQLDNEAESIASTFDNFLPSTQACTDLTVNFTGAPLTISCERFNGFREVLGWFFAVITALYLIMLALRPAGSK